MWVCWRAVIRCAGGACVCVRVGGSYVDGRALCGCVGGDMWMGEWDDPVWVF